MPPPEPEQCIVNTPFGEVSFQAYRDRLGSVLVPRGTVVTLEDGTLIGVTHTEVRIPQGRASVSMSASWPSIEATVGRLSRRTLMVRLG